MDRTLELLSTYACGLTYEALPAEVVHQIKRTLIDTLGCAMGAFHAEPSRIARGLAESVTSRLPARLLGTRHTSSPDMAGFANGVMVRYLDCNDSYFSPGGGHPSDMIPAALALADPLGCDGRTMITAIVLGWASIRPRCATLSRWPWSPTCLWGVTRVGELPMWKGCATASATRAAIFAAQLAQQGMTGPAEPFEGRRGLWEQAVGKPVSLEKFGGNDEPFRITATTFKFFPSQIHDCEDEYRRRSRFHAALPAGRQLSHGGDHGVWATPGGPHGLSQRSPTQPALRCGRGGKIPTLCW